MKKLFIITSLICIFCIAGCSGVTKENIAEKTIVSTQEINAKKNNVIEVMTGEIIDFNKLLNDEIGQNSKVTKIEIVDPSEKDNIEEEMKNSNSYIIFRKNGRVTSFNMNDGTLKIVHSDGKDMAVVKVSYRNDVTAKNDFEKTYTVIYDCNSDYSP